MTITLAELKAQARERADMEGSCFVSDSQLTTFINNSIAELHDILIQAYDGDLASVAGLAGTSGLLRKDAVNTWSLDTNTYLTGNQTITLTGDASGSGTTSIAVTVEDDSHAYICKHL